MLVGVGLGVTLHVSVVVQVPVLAIVPPVIVSRIFVMVCPVNNCSLVTPVAMDSPFDAPPLVVPEMLNGPASVDADPPVNVNVTVICFVSFYKYLFILFFSFFYEHPSIQLSLIIVVVAS